MTKIKQLVMDMSETKKIIAALLLTAFTVLAGCIIVDCNMSDLTKEYPLTFQIANEIKSFTAEQIKALAAAVKGE